MAERATYQSQVVQKRFAEDLVFLDETSVYTNLVRTRARALGGARAPGTAPLQHKRLTILGALSLKGIAAAMSYRGSADADVVQVYVEQVLLPQMQPGQTLVLDNFQAHRGVALRNAVEAAGCTLEFLPRYSPELNPIELAWSKVKTMFRTAALRSPEALELALGPLLDRISESDARGYFAHAGYKLAPD